MKIGKVRSDLILDEELLWVAEGLVGGFWGTIVSRKHPKVKEKSAAASIWTAMLAEKKTPPLDAIKLAVRTPEKCPYLAC